MEKTIDLLNMVYRENARCLYVELDKSLKKKVKQFIITANPEIITLGIKNVDMNKAFHDSTIITADGVGVEKAIKWKLKRTCYRNTGIDIATHILNTANLNNNTLFLYGAKKEVLIDLVKKISCEYPNVKIVGSFDGYNQNYSLIRSEILKAKPDILMVATGAPNQEIFIDSIFKRLEYGICVGVGGTFDVLSGHANRAPDFFVKHNLEWLYRITKEPKRFKRFWNGNVLFFVRLLAKK